MNQTEFHLVVTNPEIPQRPPAKTRRIQGKFVRGPIPLDWLTRASKLPGRAISTGIVLWFLSGVKKSNTVVLQGSLLRSFGVKRHAGYRALQALEGASLVSVVRRSGKSPEVTILEVDPNSSSREDDHGS